MSALTSLQPKAKRGRPRKKRDKNASEAEDSQAPPAADDSRKVSISRILHVTF